MASGPDKVGTCQHCQMVRVRRARWEGIHKEPVFDASLGGAGSKSGGSGPVLRCVTCPLLVNVSSVRSVLAGQPTPNWLRRRCGGRRGRAGCLTHRSATSEHGNWSGRPSPFSHPEKRRESTRSAVRSGPGRSRRSTPSRGKPGTWGRAAASQQKETWSRQKMRR